MANGGNHTYKYNRCILYINYLLYFITRTCTERISIHLGEEKNIFLIDII